MSFYIRDFEFKKGPAANASPKDDCIQKCEIHPGFALVVFWGWEVSWYTLCLVGEPGEPITSFHSESEGGELCPGAAEDECLSSSPESKFKLFLSLCSLLALRGWDGTRPHSWTWPSLLISDSKPDLIQNGPQDTLGSECFISGRVLQLRQVDTWI